MEIEKIIQKYDKKDLSEIKAKSFKKDLMLIPHFEMPKKKINQSIKIKINPVKK